MLQLYKCGVLRLAGTVWQGWARKGGNGCEGVCMCLQRLVGSVLAGWVGVGYKLVVQKRGTEEGCSSRISQGGLPALGAVGLLRSGRDLLSGCCLLQRKTWPLSETKWVLVAERLAAGCRGSACSPGQMIARGGAGLLRGIGGASAPLLLTPAGLPRWLGGSACLCLGLVICLSRVPVLPQLGSADVAALWQDALSPLAAAAARGLPAAAAARGMRDIQHRGRRQRCCCCSHCVGLRALDARSCQPAGSARGEAASSKVAECGCQAGIPAGTCSQLCNPSDVRPRKVRCPPAAALRPRRWRHREHHRRCCCGGGGSCRHNAAVAAVPHREGALGSDGGKPKLHVHLQRQRAKRQGGQRASAARQRAAPRPAVPRSSRIHTACAAADPPCSAASSRCSRGAAAAGSPGKHGQTRGTSAPSPRSAQRTAQRRAGLVNQAGRRGRARPAGCKV